MSRKTIFISDLHLQQKQRDTTKLFKSFLKKLPQEIDAIYILGDFFEAWIGDDSRSPFLSDLIFELREAAKKCPIYIMRGNRDFLLGKKFSKLAGVTLLPQDEVLISLYGKRVLLMHGDTLCTADHGYQKARKLFHNKFVQSLFLSLPHRLREKIAQRLREKSKYETKIKTDHMMDVQETTCLELIKKYQASLLIHGHTHRPEIRRLNETCTKVVLGAWEDKGHCLIINGEGQMRVAFFNESDLRSLFEPLHDAPSNVQVR